MSRVAEMGGRPQDMCEFLMQAVQKKELHHIADPNAPKGQYLADYSKRERDTIYVGMKNAVSPLRVTLRLISAISDNPKYNKFNPMLQKLRAKVMEELNEKCEAIAAQILKFSIGRKGNSTETEVFFNKMIADFYRYIAEFTQKSDTKALNYCKEKCQKHYTRAYDLSRNGMGFKKALHPCNTTRLSTVLHFGNFLNEQMGQPEQAVVMCTDAIQLSEQSIGDISDEGYQEVKHI